MSIHNIRLGLYLLISLFISCRNDPSTGYQAAGFELTDTMLSRISLNTVQLEQVSAELKLSGKITPEDNKVASIFPIVSGYVTRVNVSLGDHVKKGAILAVIRSTDIADFEKQRRGSETELLLARQNLRSAQELYESKLNTERDVAAAQKAVDDAHAELNRISEVFHIYHVDTGSYYNVVAPISGFITEKKLNADMQLPQGVNENIFTIAQIDEVFVTANVYETDIYKISLNMDAEITVLSYPREKYQGKIDKIMNILDPETKTLKIRIRLPNRGYLLKPEMAATVHLRYHEPYQLPAIPAESIVFDKSKNYVMVFHGKDSMETRFVEVLGTAGGKAYVSAGLQPGEEVIVRNALLVYDAIND